MRKLVYYVAASLDGRIADADGDPSAFPNDPATLAALFDRYPETCPAHVRGALGITAEPARFDAVILGRRTHQPAIDAGLEHGAYPHLEQYVVSRSELPAGSRLHRLSGDLSAEVRELKARPGRDIWLCGGAEIARQLVTEIDEIQVKLNPVLLGRGVPLLPFDGAARPLRLDRVEPLTGDVLLLTYSPA